METKYVSMAICWKSLFLISLFLFLSVGCQAQEPSYTISANAGARGTIMPSGIVVVEQGISQVFTIIPDQGYTIGDVIIDGISVGAIPDYTFENVTTNHTINATFAIMGTGIQTQISVETSSSSQMFPSISNSYITWEDNRNCLLDSCFRDVYLYNIVTGNESLIERNNGTIAFFQTIVTGEYLVFAALTEDFTSDIYLYHIPSQIITLITPETPDTSQSAPFVEYPWVTWKDTRDVTCDIYMYNIDTAETTVISRDVGSCDFIDPAHPAKISGDQIVWEGVDSSYGYFDIYLYNIDTNTTTLLTPSTESSDQFFPSISGDNVVWEDYRNGESDIYLYNISTHEETLLTPDTEFTSQTIPLIDGDIIIWVDITEIQMYDLLSRTSAAVVTDMSGSTIYPAFSVDRIVWQDYLNDNDDIFMFTHGIEGITCPEADFTVDITAGNPPLDIYFDDLTSPTPQTWTWDFGDGNTSRLQNPVNTYATAGTYDVRLTVSTPYCRDAKEELDLIHAGTPPVADFLGTPVSGYVPLMVTFNDTSTGSPVEWTWDYGDGEYFTTSDPTKKDPTHTYSIAGLYSVNLTVSNSYGNDSHIETNYISVFGRTGDLLSMEVPCLEVVSGDPWQSFNFDTSQCFNFTANDNVLTFYPPSGYGIEWMTISSFDGIGLSNQDGIISGNLTGVLISSDRISLTGFGYEIGNNNTINYFLNLSSYPVHGHVSVYKWEGYVPSDYDIMNQVVLYSDFAGITDIAYEIGFVTENLNSPYYASIILSINSSWVEVNGGRDAIYLIHIWENATSRSAEVLPLEYQSTDTIHNIDYFRAESPTGFSRFVLTALYGTGNPLQIIVLTVQQWLGPSGGSDDSGGGPIVTQTTRSPATHYNGGTAAVVTILPSESTPTPQPEEEVPQETPIPTATFPSIEQTTAPLPAPTTKAPLPAWISGLALAAGMGLWLARRRN